MSLNWNFKTELIGYAEDNNGWRYTIYTGNALLIFLSEANIERDSDTFNYCLNNFFADEQHLKNCIKNNVFDGKEYRGIYLLPCKNTLTFVKHAMGKWRITIFADTEENKNKIYSIRDDIRNENHEN